MLHFDEFFFRQVIGGKKYWKILFTSQSSYSQPAEGRLRPKIINGGRSIYFSRDLPTSSKFGDSPIHVVNFHEISPPTVNLVTAIDAYTFHEICPLAVNLVTHIHAVKFHEICPPAVNLVTAIGEYTFHEIPEMF